MIDQYVIIITSIITSIFASIIKEIIQELYNQVKKIIIKIYEKITDRILGKLIIIIIDSLEDNERINNMLLINALTYDCKSSNRLNLRNKSSDKSKFTDNNEMQKSKKLFFHLANSYTENNITITYIKRESSTKNEKSEKKIQHIVTIKSRLLIHELEEYIEKKRNDYIDFVIKKDDNIYLYTPIYKINAVTFIETKFMTNQTFENWFSCKKDSILKVIDKYEESKNKFGMLIHGLPGCGKTSLIKCIANKYKRNIVRVYLDKFKNVNTFYQLFFEDTIIVESVNGGQKYLPQNKRLYIFEEIDTMGKIVHARENLKDEIVNTKDEITLGNILEILDGLNEMKESMFIMTTNNIEILDPALIREGRINLKIELSNYNNDEIVDMLTYNYNIKDEDQENMKIIHDIAIRNANRINPSKLNNLCKIHNLLELMKILLSN